MNSVDWERNMPINSFDDMNIIMILDVDSTERSNKFWGGGSDGKTM